MRNPFKRKKQAFSKDEILWIPGNWADRNEIVAKIAASGEFLFAGFALMNLQTKEAFALQVFDRQDFDNLEFFGAYKDAPFFVRIDLSQSQFNETNSIVKAGNAILNAGGISVLAEKSRHTYSVESWQKQLT